jgi:Na+/proline symporter
MTPYSVLAIIAGYFVLLILISFLTSRNSNRDSFYTGNKQSPWYLVAFGMIGASLSGVTFISIPGTVAAKSFGYMQVVFGYMIGYLVIALVLMPLYYRLNLTSIYAFLEKRIGRKSQLTGASFFLLSRVIGASLRMYLVVVVLQQFVVEPLGYEIHYSITVFISLALIWAYTFRSGIKTIVWSDALQTFFMLFSLVLSLILIANSFDWSFAETITKVQESDYSKIFFFDDILGKTNFFKQFIGGAVIAIAMTGLDQDMMQKNLTCKSLGDAQKNIYWFSAILIVVNLLFLGLGALLYLYVDANTIAMPTRMVNGELSAATDLLFPTIAMSHLGQVSGAVFLIGLIAAAYSSADSALTSLTTSFSLDFLRLEKNKDKYPKHMRTYVHLGFSFLLFVTIIIFYEKNDTSAIYKLFTLAGFTYGPLLGLFFFGILSKKTPKDIFVPIVCVVAPVLCYILDYNSVKWLGGYQFGFELLLVNGLLTYLGLILLPERD